MTMEEIQIINFDNNIVLQKEFYLNTELRYTYSGRDLFINKKNKVIPNGHCSFDEAKNYLDFYGVYFSAVTSSEADKKEIDLDFEIGINNLENNIENILLQHLTDNNKEIYIMLRVSNPKDDYRTVFHIEHNHDIVFSQCLSQNIYIIKYNTEYDFSIIKNYISGYLFNNNNDDLEINQRFYSIMDLKNIQNLLENFDILMFRTPVYVNYNLTFYSKNKLDFIIDIISHYSNEELKVMLRNSI